ncbi:MAG: hypothetical protein AB7V26_05780 [Lysobacterales bacterium]
MRGIGAGFKGALAFADGGQKIGRAGVVRVVQLRIDGHAALCLS